MLILQGDQEAEQALQKELAAANASQQQAAQGLEAAQAQSSELRGQLQAQGQELQQLQER